jgi:hypothetical protein
LKGILSSNYSFPHGDRLIVFQIGLSNYTEETHVSLETEPFMIEATASSTLFYYENCLVFERNAFCKS